MQKGALIVTVVRRKVRALAAICVSTCSFLLAADVFPALPLTSTNKESDEVRGVAIGPDGTLAKGAKVAIVGGKLFALVKPDATIENFNQFPVISCYEDGSFSLRRDPDGETVLIVHERGFAGTSVINWQDGCRVQLRAWTPAIGKMQINGEPAANEGIIVSEVRFPGSRSPIHLQDFETSTDAAGNFFFERLPPGEITIQWKVPTGARSFSYSHPQAFVIDTALQTRVKYELRGRTVRGKVIAPEDFDWNADHVFGTLGENQRKATEFDALGVPTQAEHFALVFGNGGSFEAKAVPPGKYHIAVRAHQQNGSLMQIYGTVSVPEGAGSIDLGEVVVTNKVQKISGPTAR